VAFSSIAGRFGNGGQTDYSAANDLLCKEISGLRRTRPETLGLAVDWTAWGGIGMATRGSIPTVMAAAGIDMLPPAVGVPFIRRELAAGGGGEVVVAGRLGRMMEEFDPTGGLDLAAPLASTGVMVGRVTGMGIYSGLTVETTLDPAEQPFLDHHRIDGTPVLPGVMGIEGFAEAAALLFPDLRVAAVEDVEFLAPFKLYRGEPRTFTIEVLFRPGDASGEVVADARLLGRRDLPGQSAPQVTVHFKARVRLVPATTLESAGESLPVPAEGNGSAVAAADIYRIYFHGPAYRVMESAWRHGDGVAGRLARPLPPDHRPEELPTLMEPRLIELCFQTAGVGELGTHGRMALPLKVDRVTAPRRNDKNGGNGTPLYAVAGPRDGDGAVDAYVVDGAGNVYLSLSGYRTIELPGSVAADRVAPLRAAMMEPALMEAL
jgi:polyketide synthase-like dehydratase family protein/polyketide synthase family protein/KR domain-containing protein